MDPAQPTSIELDIDADVISVNRNIETWRTRARRAERARAAVQLVVQDIPPPCWDKYFVTLIRCAPTRLDDDNLRASFKSFRDQLAQWIGLNDNDPRIRWDYAQRVERVRNELPRARTKFKVWARVRLSAEPHDLAAEESAMRARTPRAPPREVDGQPARFVTKPKAIPDQAGGTPVQQWELHPRVNGGDSRVRVRLMRNTRDEGIGKGVLYAHLSVFWTDPRTKVRWRSQGLSLRQEEIRDAIICLTALADSIGVPPSEGGRGVKNIFSEGTAESDTLSNDMEIEKECREKCDTPPLPNPLDRDVSPEVSSEYAPSFPPIPPPWRPV